MVLRADALREEDARDVDRAGRVLVSDRSRERRLRAGAKPHVDAAPPHLAIVYRLSAAFGVQPSAFGASPKAEGRKRVESLDVPQTVSIQINRSGRCRRARDQAARSGNQAVVGGWLRSAAGRATQCPARA